MPKTKIIFYQEKEGQSLIFNWFKDLQKINKKGFAKCFAKINLLSNLGYELQRPTVDFVTDDIWELRVRYANIQYRIFYFFSGKNVVILTHAIIKKTSSIPTKEIEKVLLRKNNFLNDPNYHTYRGGLNDL